MTPDELMGQGPFIPVITNKPGALALCQRLGLENRLQATEPRYRGALVLRNGKPYAVPDGFQLLRPSALWPVLTSPILSWPGKLRLAWEYFVPRRTESGDESLANFVRRRFGAEALDRLVQPLVGLTLVKADVDLKSALRDESVVNYRQTVQSAFKDTHDALVPQDDRVGQLQAPLLQGLEAVAECPVREVAHLGHLAPDAVDVPLEGLFVVSGHFSHEIKE